MTPAKHPTRKQLRLAEFDYSTPADYFITLVTHQRQPIFGTIHDAEITPSAYGAIVLSAWNALPARYPHIALGPFVLMPNHLHAVITITDLVETSPLTTLPSYRAERRKMTLPLILGYFKTTSAKQINLLRNSPSTPVWQRNYYEHIIHSEDEYQQIEAYIANNPANWLTADEYRTTG